MRTRQTVAAVVVAAACLSHAAIGDYVFIDDGEMADSSWTTMVVNPTGGFGFTAGQAGSGGNPGAYRSIFQFSTAGVASGLVVHVHDGLLAGPVAGVGMSVDVNCFSGGTSAAVAFGLVIEQGGAVYFGPTFTALTASGWRTDLSHPNLQASAFSDGVSPPDFSGAGAPLRFGFYTSNGTGSGVPISATSGADNFRVNIFPAPCPFDINHDGAVNTLDLTALLARFGQSVVPGSAGDIVVDGAVNTLDLTALLAHFGQTCP